MLYIITGPDGQTFETSELRAAAAVVAAFGRPRETITRLPIFKHVGSTIFVEVTC
jgi:hypothetical protein